MSGAGRRHHHHKKGGRHPPSSSSILENPQGHYDPQFIQQQPNATLQYPPDVAYTHGRLEANAPDPRYDEANPTDSLLYMNPQSNTAYNSPDQAQLQIGQYATPEFQSPYHLPYSLGVVNQYDEYGNPMYADADYHPYSGIQQTQYEQHPGSAYYNHPGMMQPQYPAPGGYYTNSPPTPAASDQIRDRKRVKASSRRIAPHQSAETPRDTPDNTSHPAKAPGRKSSENPAKPAKHTKNKKGKGDVPILTAPLSELTKSYNIPLKDMDEWVNRSVETRLKECTKKEGWIPRPMNSFMLYRSAYAERTKHWCLQNNHQVVSSVSGLSWPMEPPEIRERFIEYARQERENHAKAHPQYKFSPAKTDASRRKRKGATTEQDDDESVDLEELDYDWQPGKSSKDVKRKGRAKRAKTEYHSEDPVNRDFHVEYETRSVHNPGKRRPPRYDGLEHYHEVMVDANFFEPNRGEDASFLEAEASHLNDGPKEELVGLPGADHHELLVDPQLNGDNIHLGGNLELPMPLDPDIDSANWDDFDISQLSQLGPSVSANILKILDEPEKNDTPESKPIGPSMGRNQYSHQNEAENEHQKSVQNEGLNEYENGYLNVYRDIYQNELPEEFEDEKSDEFANPPQHTSIPADHRPTIQKVPEKLDQGKVEVEKSDDEKKPDDEKPPDELVVDEFLGNELFGEELFGEDFFGDHIFGDEKAGDEKPGDEKPSEEKPGDEKPGDEKPGDEKPGDEKPGDEKPGDEKPGDEKPSDEKPDNEKPDDEKPNDEKPDDGDPGYKNPDDEIPGRENLDHRPSGDEKPSSTKKRSR